MTLTKEGGDGRLSERELEVVVVVEGEEERAQTPAAVVDVREEAGEETEARSKEEIVPLTFAITSVSSGSVKE